MKTVLSSIYLIYLGLILGVSFLATPVKFRASRLTLPVALEVGRETFHAFNKIEWGILFTLVTLTFVTNNHTFQWFNLVLFILLALGTFYLLPKLDHRIEMILQGQQLSRSMLHRVYVSAELCKLILIFSGAFYLQRKGV